MKLPHYMEQHPSLKNFCPNQAMYTRLRNALWSANGYTTVIPKRWEPQPKHFLSLQDEEIAGVGKASLKILREWVRVKHEQVPAP